MTLAKVAEHAGVSTATVSMILNGQDDERFRPETRRRVLSAAKALSYSNDPSHPRRRRRRQIDGKRVRQVAFIHPHAWSSKPDQAANYYAPILDGIQIEARREATQLILGTGLETAEQQMEFVTRPGSGIDGMLLAGEIDSTVLDCVLSRHIPAVFCSDRCCAYGQISTVMGDTAHGAYVATRHLITLGHHRVAAVGYFGRIYYFGVRLAGYARAMVKAGLTVDPGNIVDADAQRPFDQAINQLMTGASPPTALFFAEEGLIRPAIGVLRSLGLSVPRDVSIAAVGCWMPQDRYDPLLTSADYSLPDLGRFAFLRLNDMLRGKDPGPSITMVPTQLTIRGSTAAPRSEQKGGQ